MYSNEELGREIFMTTRKKIMVAQIFRKKFKRFEHQSSPSVSYLYSLVKVWWDGPFVRLDFKLLALPRVCGPAGGGLVTRHPELVGHGDL